ncbi:MAG: ABC transporter ATP-binding protein [Aggregatilineales bacterium]
MTAAIELQNIKKEFPARRGETPTMAVETMNMTINDGEFFSMLGPSGCGKTTTLRMIAGFEEPTGGKILIEGHDVVGIPPFHRPVNTVFQDYALFPHMTVAQNVAFGLEMEGKPRKEIAARVQELLQLVQLPNMDRRFPKQLSGGQQQRVALARALIKAPRVLLLDEPLGALDLKLRKQMQLELKHMQRRLGITFIYVTHDQEEALTMSDRIAVMDKGHVLQIGLPVEIYNRPATRFVADFIGETNFISATVSEVHGDETSVLVDDRLPLRVSTHDSVVNPGDKITIAIRPEKIDLRSPRDEATNCLPGKIEECIFIGTDNRYVVRVTEKTALVVREQNGMTGRLAQFEVGADVRAECSAEHALILTA